MSTINLTDLVAVTYVIFIFFLNWSGVNRQQLLFLLNVFLHVLIPYFLRIAKATTRIGRRVAIRRVKDIAVWVLLARTVLNWFIENKTVFWLLVEILFVIDDNSFLWLLFILFFLLVLSFHVFLFQFFSFEELLDFFVNFVHFEVD